MRFEDDLEFKNEITRKDLLKLIEEAPESRVVKPSVITKDSVYSESDSGYIGDFMYYLEREKEEYPDYGMKIIDGELSLFPINPNFKVLEYRTCLTNNLTILENWGCFGEPDYNKKFYHINKYSATAPITGKIKPRILKEHSKNEKIHICEPITLIIDKEKLMEKRSIFINPFSILGDTKFPLGNSYFIVGGIPKEAVMGFEKDKPLKEQLKERFPLYTHFV